MRISFEIAAAADAAELADLHCAVAHDLTKEFGRGHWSSQATERGVLAQMRHGKVFVHRRRGRIAATLVLCTKKPWAIDVKHFTPVRKAVYLLNMAVHPKWQRQGLGTKCIAMAAKAAREWPAEAIRLDAYNAAAGAGEFYAKAGFAEVGRVVYRGVGLVYFEMLV